MSVSKELGVAFNKMCKKIRKSARESGMSDQKLAEVLGKRTPKIIGEVLVEVKRKGLIEQLSKKEYDFGSSKETLKVQNPYR